MLRRENVPFKRSAQIQFALCGLRIPRILIDHILVPSQDALCTFAFSVCEFDCFTRLRARLSGFGKKITLAVDFIED